MQSLDEMGGKCVSVVMDDIFIQAVYISDCNVRRTASSTCPI